MSPLIHTATTLVERRQWDALVHHLDRMSTTEIEYVSRHFLKHCFAMKIVGRILHMRQHNVYMCIDGRYRGRR